MAHERVEPHWMWGVKRLPPALTPFATPVTVLLPTPREGSRLGTTHRSCVRLEFASDRAHKSPHRRQNARHNPRVRLVSPTQKPLLGKVPTPRPIHREAPAPTEPSPPMRKGGAPANWCAAPSSSKRASGSQALPACRLP